MTERIAYDVVEVATMLGRSPLTVRGWIRSGVIPGRKLGKLWMVPAWAVDELREGYHAERERAQRGEPVPALEGRPLGGDGDDGGRTPPVTVRRVQGRGARQPAGAAPATGPRDPARPAKRTPWTVPPEVAG